MKDRVLKAKELLATASPYPQGCSGFVCAVLGIPWQNANSLMGGGATPAGDNNYYYGLNPGDVADWKSMAAAAMFRSTSVKPGRSSSMSRATARLRDRSATLTVWEGHCTRAPDIELA